MIEYKTLVLQAKLNLEHNLLIFQPGSHIREVKLQWDQGQLKRIRIQSWVDIHYKFSQFQIFFLRVNLELSKYTAYTKNQIWSQIPEAATGGAL